MVTQPEERLRVRTPSFAVTADRALSWHATMPELAAAANGISLLMPYVEPYLARSVRAVLPHLDEPLRSRTDGFVRQELAHHAVHRRFNDALAGACPGVAPVERLARRTYAWLARTRSDRFHIAFAAGSEAIAFGIARWVDANVAAVFDGADPEVADLYIWHLAEEVEHKTAAFDVFEATGGSRIRLAAATTLSLALLVAFTYGAALVQLRAQRRLRLPVTWFRLARWSLSLAFTVLPTVAVSCLPGHHPSALADPPYLRQWLRSFDPSAPRTAPGRPSDGG